MSDINPVFNEGLAFVQGRNPRRLVADPQFLDFAINNFETAREQAPWTEKLADTFKLGDLFGHKIYQPDFERLVNMYEASHPEVSPITNLNIFEGQRRLAETHVDLGRGISLEDFKVARDRLKQAVATDEKPAPLPAATAESAPAHES